MIQENPLGYIIEIAKGLEKVLEKNVWENTGVTHTDAKLLMAIRYGPDASQVEIAEALRVSPAAVSRQIKKLVEKKYIIQKIKKESRRESEISLTNLGIETEKKVQKYLEMTLTNILHAVDGISPRTVEELLQVREALSGNINPIFQNMKSELKKQNN